MYSIGRHSYSYATRRGDANNVVIGNFCSVAENTVLGSGFQHHTDYVSTFPFKTIWSELPSNINLDKGDVIIENDVWVGEGCFIMEGAKLMSGCIVGANSVVTKDVPPYAIVGGSPARLIRYRYDEETIKRLLQIQWWYWNDEKIRENIHLLQSNNIQEFINKHYKNQ